MTQANTEELQSPHASHRTISESCLKRGLRVRKCRAKSVPTEIAVIASSNRRVRKQKFSLPGSFLHSGYALIPKRAWQWCTSDWKWGLEIQAATA